MKRSLLFVTAALVACAACRSPVESSGGDTGSSGLDSDTAYNPDLFDASPEDEDAGIAGSCPESSPRPYNNNYSPYFGGEEQIAVTVEVATDFGCPYCASFASKAHEIWARREDFRKNVRFYFHNHFLEGLHPASPDVHACAAAVANQDVEAFWRLHDEIYARKSGDHTMSVDETVAWIEANLDIDAARFHAERSSIETKAFLAWDKEQGVQAGVQGTPTVFVCGQLLDRWSDIEEAVDAHLLAK